MLTKYIIIRNANDNHEREVFAGWGFKSAVWNRTDSKFPTLVIFDDQVTAAGQLDIIAKQEPNESAHIKAIQVEAL